MNKLKQGRGYFTRDGQLGQITAVFNDGLFGTFKADSGAQFTIEAHEFEAVAADQPAAEAQSTRFAKVARDTRLADTQRKAPAPARTIARFEPPHRGGGGA